MKKAETRAGYGDMTDDEEPSRDTIPDMQYYGEQDPGMTKAGFATPEGSAKPGSTPESRMKHFDMLVPIEASVGMSGERIEKSMDDAGLTQEERAAWWKRREVHQAKQEEQAGRYRAEQELAVAKKEEEDTRKIEGYTALLAEIGERTISQEEYQQLLDKYGLSEKLTTNVIMDTGELGRLKAAAFKKIDFKRPDSAMPPQKPKRKGLLGRLLGR